MTNVCGPDFICVGMPKAGTGWLYDQLLVHPDFWMPPVKEIDYLDHDRPKMKHAIAKLERAQSGSRVRRRALDERDRQFLQEAAACGGQARDYARYASLFRPKEQLLSGDISPSYSRLEENVIGEIAKHLPQLKIILLVRDPVARAWSHISLLDRSGKLDRGVLDDEARFRSFLENPKNIQRRSFATRVAERWARVAPQIAFRHFFFDDIQGSPDEVRKGILQYLGADSKKESGQVPAAHNRKADAPKLSLTDALKGVLVEYFAEELRASARIFGGHAIEWKHLYAL
jgi:hypothetical protein